MTRELRVARALSIIALPIAALGVWFWGWGWLGGVLLGALGAIVIVELVERSVR